MHTDIYVACYLSLVFDREGPVLVVIFCFGRHGLVRVLSTPRRQLVLLTLVATKCVVNLAYSLLSHLLLQYQRI